tara:strand:- start:976 stop:1782 length:807 start_codon:yes stop_codon:yes gene_type:complete
MIETYGILKKNSSKSKYYLNCEELMYKGYTIYSPGYDKKKLKKIDTAFQKILSIYKKKYLKYELNKINEATILRSPLLIDQIFLDLAMDKGLIKIVSFILKNNYYLNQQNGLINQSRKKFAQASWHRDLPYQHFVSSHPLAVNAIYCIDDFTIENGSTSILPGSHLKENFPTELFCKNNQLFITAKKGSFIILDAMIFHRGNFNNSSNARKAINHVFTSPIISQQIMLKDFKYKLRINKKIKKFLGNFQTYESPEKYLSSRIKKFNGK